MPVIQETGIAQVLDRGSNPIRILIVDDHPTLIMGLKIILESEPDMLVVGQSGSASESIALHNELRPDVTIMDIKLGESSGISATEEIRASNPKARIIILTSFDRDEDIYKSIVCGAVGYIVKDTPASEIVHAIRQVHIGRKHFSSSIAEKLSDRLTMTDLSEREFAVLRLIANGKANKEIAAELHIALATVKYYVNNLLLKLNADDRTQAVVNALRKGMIDL